MSNKIIQFLNTIIPTISEKANKIVDVSMLIDKSWFFLNDFSDKTKIVYLFNSENELLISKNGIVSVGKWKSIIHSTNSLLLTVDSAMIFYNIIFLNFEYLILQQDGTSKYLFFAKQEKYIFSNDLNSFDSFVGNYIEDIKSYLNSNNSHCFTLPDVDDEPIPQNKNQNETNIQVEILHPKIETSFKMESIENKEKFLKPHQKDGKWGYINEENRIVVDHKFDDAYHFYEGLAAVIINGKRGYINERGEYAIKPVYQSGTYFKDGKAEVTLNGEDFYIDKDGNKLF